MLKTIPLTLDDKNHSIAKNHSIDTLKRCSNFLTNPTGIYLALGAENEKNDKNFHKYIKFTMSKS